MYADDELKQTYHLVIRPQAGRVDQILVFASEKLDGEVRWMEKSSGTPMTVERLPVDDPRRGSLPADGELWRLHLSRPQDKSVEIDATLVSAWPSRRSVPLLSLPEATDQRGRVLLSIASEHAPKLEARGPRPIPLPTNWRGVSNDNDGSRMWAAYRYDPAECLSVAGRTELWIEPTTKAASADVTIVRQVKLESFYAASGDAAHRATYRLESPVAASVQLQAPAGCQLTSAELDGRMLEVPTGRSAGEPLTIPLVAGQPSDVTISFSSSESPLASGSELQPPRLESNLPILAGDWAVWLPTEFVVVGGDAMDGGMNWRQRLFGPLGRPNNNHPFDPRNASSWSKLLTGWAEEGPAAGSTPEVNGGAPVRDNATVATGGAAPLDGIAAASGASPTAKRAGWRAYRRLFVAGWPEPIIVAHPSATMAWSVAIFLLCLAGGSTLRRRHDWFGGLVATAASLCLLLPTAFVPLATGAFLGLLASLVMRWPRRADPADAPTRTWTRLATAGATGMLLAALLVSLAKAQSTRGAEDTDPQTKSAKIERVLVPVDAERRPSGSKVYVGERFLRRLLADSTPAVPDESEWLLTKASYAGELQHSPDGADELAGTWRMALGIDVLGRETKIRIPLVRDEADWPATVQLDGIPVPLEWDANGRSGTVVVAEPGRYELTISFVPRVRTEAARNQIELTLPPWRGAALDLRFPAVINVLEAVGGNLQRRDDRSTGVMTGELDGSGRLAVRWQSAAAPAGGPKEAQITELRWLRIDSSGVEMDMKYVAPRDTRLPKEFEIVADGLGTAQRREFVTRRPSCCGVRRPQRGALGARDGRSRTWRSPVALAVDESARIGPRAVAAHRISRVSVCIMLVGDFERSNDRVRNC